MLKGVMLKGVMLSNLSTIIYEFAIMCPVLLSECSLKLLLRLQIKESGNCYCTTMF
ncbi:hypothetical protein JHK82_011445 [Glycine max]|uniref:Uncharacterized protein n=2 Tax=Glycine subgen. Soja TaxID=1462606 RepID=A0A0R0JPI3_SOYBN|nr:hypothetical protein JHK87_011324 [Glycine soja]KAG5039285.1 hypothetical protein JHK85_011761 [Glycine max]KAG5056440.1 hypothetical protein JHK86_011436 [Glycine max]KAG5153476.1 hypothetical protein JHK82_011445 [Glycine max]KAH1132221.1 hypothetical protein GYH30_011198 [Glycine max]